MNKDTVAICMATYNGENFLDEQIRSILEQSDSNWMLFISDDGSTDSTPSIVKRFSENHSSKIVVVNNPCVHSASKNFMNLLRFIVDTNNFQYFMFCDQDDVWKKNKIALSREKMENENNKISEPILIHTDLEVVDSNLNRIQPSFVRMRSLNTYRDDLAHLLVQNNVTGCTMYFNQILAEMALSSFADSIAMHDWWLALIASSFGKIVFIDRPTILYRQHSHNVVGATNVRSIRFVLNRLLESNRVKQTFEMSFQQAKYFLSSFESKLSKHEIFLLNKFIDLQKMNRLNKLITIIRYKFLKQGLIQIIGELLFI